IAVAPCLARYGCGLWRRAAEFVGFVSEVPKRLVLAVVDLGNNYRPTRRDAVAVVLIQRQLLPGAILENVRRVQCRMPQPPPGASMDVVGPALGVDVDCGTHGVSQRRIERRGLHLEF